MTAPTEQLPAFLRRNTTGQLELVLHCTWIQDYYVCPRKFWLRYGEMVESTGPRTALNYGGAVHEALAHRYGNMEMSLADVEAQQVGLLQQWFDAHPQPADEWRNCGRAQDLIRAYNEHWPVHDWQVLAVEEEFEVRVGEVVVPHAAATIAECRAPIPCYLAGRKDLVVAWQDHLWIVDHKTCSDWGSGDTNSHLDEGRRSFQFRGYAWAEREQQNANAKTLTDHCAPITSQRNALPIAGTIGNYLISRKPYATDKPARNGRTPLPRNQFHMECYPFESSVLDEWREECLDVAASVLRDWQRGRWAAHDTGCGHWGRCEFYDYCEESPNRRAAMLGSSLFQPKVFEREL